MSSSSTQLQRKQSKNPLLFFLCVLLPTCDSFLKFFIHHFIFSRIPLLHLDSSVTASLSNCFHLLCSVQGAYFICFFSILIRFFFSFSLLNSPMFLFYPSIAVYGLDDFGVYEEQRTTSFCGSNFYLFI